VQTSQRNIQYDYAFIGAGASTILTLLSLEHHQLLQNKKIIILDPEQKNRNDRTFCFWGTKNEINLQQILPLVSKKWNKIAVNQIDTPNPQEIEYYHIRGIDIYKQLDRLIDSFQIERSFSRVNAITDIEENVAICSESQQWLSKIAFDSRPPTFATPQNNESLLYQTFWGLNVVLENPRFDSNTIDLMDFNVPQNNQTQFVYVLPYNQSSALVELTRFGKEKIEEVEATNILNQYIQERFGNFKIIDTEEGCIPMCTSPLNDVSESKNIIKIGANAGAIKPSTGYAFKTMLKHANEIGKKIASEELPPKIAVKKRFQLYDRLLLKIIEEKPLISKSIFEKLFLKNNTSVILNFLEEKTSLKDDIKIFSTLPFFTFFKALIHDLTSNIKHEIAVLFLTILIVALQALNPMLSNTFSIILGLMALFLRGIPHGALDHLLEAKQINGTPKLSFIFKYLLLGFIYLIAWFYLPNLSFLFFIVFSIWHFGSTDIHEWKIRGFTNLKSWIWGTLIFTLILGGHTLETNEIIQKMNVTMPTINAENGQLILMIGIIISIIFSIYNRKKGLSLIVISLILSAKLPLLTSFGIYFLGQHSINGWSHLRSGLNTNNITLMKKSLPFTLGAMFLFIVLGISQKFNLYHFDTKNMVSLAFIFIACISFPHVVAMNVFYKGKKA
jgi:lycopene beta-cyclase